MKASIIASSFLIAGAFGKPVKRDYAGENVIVWKTVTVYASKIDTNKFPTATVSAAVNITKPVTEAAITSKTPSFSAVPSRHPYNWSPFNTTISAVLNITKAVIEAAPTSKSPSVSAVPSRHPYKWSPFNAKISALFNITKPVIEAAITAPKGKSPSVSVVLSGHQPKWSTYNTTVLAACNASIAPSSSYVSVLPATESATPTLKLHAFVTDAPWLLEALRTATLAPNELTSTSQLVTPSSANTSSIVPTLKLHAFVTDAPWLKEALSTATLSPTEPASTPKVLKSSSENTSSTSTTVLAAEESSSIPPASAPTPDTAPGPKNHSLDQTLEDAKIAESDGSPYSDGVHILTTINKWRNIYKLPLLRWNHQLELNALKTGTDGAGIHQKHEFNQGTLAQVIAPGMVTKYGGDLGGDTPFELSFVAWLCESSTDAELKSDEKDQCQIVDENLHVIYTEMGHYEILTSKVYTKIGCAFADDPELGSDIPYQGLWVCDLN